MRFDDDDERPRHYRVKGTSFVVGPEWINFVVTLFLGAVPICIFFVFIAEEVIQGLGWIPVIAVAVLSIAMYTSLLLTGLLDPGIIPREEPTAQESMLPRQKEYDINGFAVTTKRCITCHIYRPPRCSHCAVCNNCVEKFDHHCPWVGTCIGRRNYQPYLAFIYTAFLECILVIGLCVWRLVTETIDQQKGDGDSFRGALKTEPVAAILIAYCFMCVLFVGALSGLHTYLLATNQTTYEYFRHRYAPSDNPFRRTLMKNTYEAMCGATGLYRYYPDDTHPAQTRTCSVIQNQHQQQFLPPPPLLDHSGNLHSSPHVNGNEQYAQRDSDERPYYSSSYQASGDVGVGVAGHESERPERWTHDSGPSRVPEGGVPLGDASNVRDSEDVELHLELTTSPRTNTHYMPPGGLVHRDSNSDTACGSVVSAHHASPSRRATPYGDPVYTHSGGTMDSGSWGDSR